MNTFLTPCDTILLLLHAKGKPTEANEVAPTMQRMHAPKRMTSRRHITIYLQDLRDHGYVDVSSEGFFLTRTATESLLPRITACLSDEDLELFSQ